MKCPKCEKHYIKTEHGNFKKIWEDGKMRKVCKECYTINNKEEYID